LLKESEKKKDKKSFERELIESRHGGEWDRVGALNVEGKTERSKREKYWKKKR